MGQLNTVYEIPKNDRSRFSPSPERLLTICVYIMISIISCGINVLPEMHAQLIIFPVISPYLNIRINTLRCICARIISYTQLKTHLIVIDFSETFE